MAKDSKTILLFTEQRDAIAYLTDEEAGQMFKAIYDYAEDGVVPKFAGPMMSLFVMIRSQIDRSRDAYKDIIRKTNRAPTLKRNGRRSGTFQKRNGCHSLVIRMKFE